MTYYLQGKALASTPTNVHISDYILQTRLSSLTITDHLLNVLCTKTYPGIILEAMQTTIDQKHVVIVLIEACKIEVSEFIYKNHEYILVPKSLKYYEKLTKPASIIPNMTDIDSVALYCTNSFFCNYKNHVFTKISDNLIAYCDIKQKQNSWIINTRDDLKINFYIAFDYLKYFAIPTLAILTEKKIIIYSFENNCAIKIDEIDIKNNVFDVRAMKEGFCYIRLKDKMANMYELVIVPYSNMRNSLSIEFENVKCIRVHENDIYLFCSNGLFRIEVIVLLGSIKEHNITEIWGDSCDFGYVNDNFIYIGSNDNDCYLINYIKEVVQDSNSTEKSGDIAFIHYNTHISNDKKTSATITSDNKKERNIDATAEKRNAQNDFLGINIRIDDYDTDYNITQTKDHKDTVQHYTKENDSLAQGLDTTNNRSFEIKNELHCMNDSELDEAELVDIDKKTEINSNYIANLKDDAKKDWKRGSSEDTSQQSDIHVTPMDRKEGETSSSEELGSKTITVDHLYTEQNHTRDKSSNQDNEANDKHKLESDGDEDIYIQKSKTSYDSIYEPKTQQPEPVQEVEQIYDLYGLGDISNIYNIKTEVNLQNDVKNNKKCNDRPESNLSDCKLTVEQNVGFAQDETKMEEKIDANNAIAEKEKSDTIPLPDFDYADNANAKISIYSEKAQPKTILNNYNTKENSTKFDDKQYNEIYSGANVNITNIKKIKTEEIKNYSVKDIKKIDLTFYGVGNKKIIKFQDFLSIKVFNSTKIKGFSRFYCVDNIICMTNERETFFMDFQSEVNNVLSQKEKSESFYASKNSVTGEKRDYKTDAIAKEQEITNKCDQSGVFGSYNNLDTSNMTLNFFVYKNNLVHATKKSIVFADYKIDFDNEITKVLGSDNFLYVLINDTVKIYNNDCLISEIVDVELFDLSNGKIYVLNNSVITIYEENSIRDFYAMNSVAVEASDVVHTFDNPKNAYKIITLQRLEDENEAYVNIRILQFDNTYVIIQTQRYFYIYSIVTDKVQYLKKLPTPNENALLIVLKDKIFIAPDCFVFFNKNNVYCHKIQKKALFVSDNFLLNRNGIIKYQIQEKYNFYSSFCVTETKTEEKNHYIDFDTENQIFTIGSESKAESESSEEENTDVNKNDIVQEENMDENFSNDAGQEEEEKEPEIIPIHKSRFKISIHSPDFTCLDHFRLECNEYLTDLKFVKLNTNLKTEIISSSYYFPFLIATTSILKGFKSVTKGRILVFEIKNVQSKDIDVKKKKLSVIAKLDLNVNTFGFTIIRGNIAICQGTRIMIYKFDRLNGLTAIAFHDMHIITTSISCVKNYIVASDILKGVSFHYFQNKPVKIHKLSISNEIKACHLNRLFVFDKDLLIVCFDRRSVYFFSYKPWESTSLKGTFLIAEGEGDLEEKVLGCGADFFYSSANIYFIKTGEIDEGKILKSNKRFKMKNIKETRMLM